MSSPRVQFRVDKPFPRDSGSSVAVVSSDTLDELGWSVGDVVEIRGTEDTVATLASSPSDETKVRGIRLDIFTRKSTGVSIGDSVDVSLAEPESAETIVVEVPDGPVSTGVGPERVRQDLMGKPVTKNQYVPIRLDRGGPSQSVALLIAEVRPDGVAVVSEDTEIKLDETNGTRPSGEKRR